MLVNHLDPNYINHSLLAKQWPASPSAEQQRSFNFAAILAALEQQDHY